MCLRPIEIYNPQKYINLYHGDQFLLTVPCNECAECRERNSNEWHFRTHYMFKDCLGKGGYVLFETLTYNDKHLPHLSDFIDVDGKLDFPCFNRDHIRKFFVRLRRMLDYRNLGKISYFLTSEYGTQEYYHTSSGRLRRATHRPHYHILFFVDSNIDPLLLCRFIRKCWQFGVTDWSNNGDDYILEKRVFKDYSLHGMRLANYVSKYVQKDSSFTSIVNARIEQILDNKYQSDDPSVLACRKTERIKLRNLMAQFHLQSKGYGLSYLSSLEFNRDEVENTGMVKFVVPDAPNIYKHIPLPMYYFRHLYQEQIEVDGKRYWQCNIDGVRYRKLSEQRKHHNFVVHLRNWKMNLGALPLDYQDKVFDIFKDIDLDSLASYVLFLRGRYCSTIDYAPLSDKLENIQFYHYGSMNDFIIYDKRFVTPKFLGNDVLGYDSISCPIPRKLFAAQYTYLDSKLEYAYKIYLDVCRYQSSNKQDTFDYKQRLENLYKSIFAR